MAEVAAEDFEKFRDKTNKAIDDIGRQKGTAEKQLDILDSLSNLMGGDSSVIPTEYLKSLGLRSGTTIKQGKQELLQKTLALSGADVDLKQGIVNDSKTQIGLLNEISDRNVTVKRYNEVNKLLGWDNFITATNDESNLSVDQLIQKQKAQAYTAYENAKTLDERNTLKQFLGISKAESEYSKSSGDINLVRTINQQRADYYSNDLNPTSDFSLQEILDALAIKKKISDLQTPAFATGGIVGGTNYTGDQNVVRVNSGEMILNQSDQANLFRLIKGGRLSTDNQQAIVVNVMIDQKVFGRAIVDAQNLQKAGLL